jgi:hypothetical protein
MHSVIHVETHVSAAFDEIPTAPQGELITPVLSAQQIIELAGLWGFV